MSRSLEPLSVGRVIGEVVDIFNPSVRMNVTYSTKQVANGHELMPSIVMNKPRVDIGGDDLRSAYTLVSYSFILYNNIYVSSISFNIWEWDMCIFVDDNLLEIIRSLTHLIKLTCKMKTVTCLYTLVQTNSYSI
jgi:hypothetical protein